MRSTIASRVVPFGCSVTSRSCGRTNVSSKRCACPTKVITNSFAGSSYRCARRGDLLDLAAVHHHDLVGDVHRLLLVVGDDDRRRVRLLVQPPQPHAQLGANLRVERAERLVEQQHGGIDGERAGEAHPLPLTAGELRRVAIREAVELHELEQLLHARLRLGLRALADLHAERDVVVDGHVLEGGVVLEDEADVAILRPAAGHVLVVDEDGSGVGRLEPRDHAQQRRLAAAARAEQGGQRPRADLDRHVVESDERPELLADIANDDRHQARDPFRWMRSMESSTMIAITASTSEMP